MIKFWDINRSKELLTDTDIRRSTRIPLTSTYLEKAACLDTLIAEAFPHYKPVRYGVNQHDFKNLDAFMNGNEGYYGTRISAAEKFLVGGAPFIDFVIGYHSVNVDGWKQPGMEYFDTMRSRLGIFSSLPEQVEVMELCITEQDTNRVSKFGEWVRKKIDESPSPFKILSFDTEDITIPPGTTALIQAACRKGLPASLVCDKPFIGSKGSKENYLARISFGDGVRWCATIRSDIETQRNGSKFYFKIKLDKLHPLLVQLLQDLPTVTGVLIRKDLLHLEEVLINCHDTQVNLPTCLDLQSLALATGWQCPVTSLQALFLTTTGTLACKDGSSADNNWSAKWAQLHTVFKAYCIGDIQMGHVIGQVFMAMLLIDVFPDPDFLCMILGNRQAVAAEWFAGLVAHCIGDTGVDDAHYRDYHSRQTLLSGLYFMDTLSNKRKDRFLYPRSVQQFGELLMDWPNFVNGGPRFLHSVRSRSPQIIAALNQIEYQHPTIGGVRLAIPINQLTFGRPIPEHEFEGVEPGSMGSLLCHPAFKGDVFPVFERNEWLIGYDAILEAAEIYQRSYNEGFCEWARLNPHLVAELFRTMAKLGSDHDKLQFWATKTTLFEKLRLIFIYTIDRLPPVVGSIQSTIEARASAAVDVQSNIALRRKNPQDELLRIEFLNARKMSGQEAPKRLSGAIIDAYSVVPGRRTMRNRRFRLKKKMKKMQMRPKERLRITMNMDAPRDQETYVYASLCNYKQLEHSPNDSGVQMEEGHIEVIHVEDSDVEMF